MLRKSPLRVTLAFFLGFFGGLSLTSSIYPFVVSTTFGVSSFEILLGVDRFSVLVGLLWAVGAGFLGWLGGAKVGAAVLGTCGLASGLTLSTLGLGGPAPVIAVGTLTGLAYGGGAGFLLGKVFEKPREGS